MFRRIRLGRTVALVPPHIRRIPGGLWTHSGCRWPAVLVGNTVGRVSRATLAPFGAGHTPWEPPVSPQEWARWIEAVSEALRSPISAWVVLPPANAHRRRFAAILLDDRSRPQAFAKWSRNPPNPLGLEAERRLSIEPPTSFTIPRLVLDGTVDGWTYSVNELLPPGPHRPADLDPDTRRRIAKEIHDALAGLDGGGQTVSHGDFAPWNVRRIHSGAVAVIDWEDVRPAPAAADELWHVTTHTLATGGSPSTALERVRTELRHHSSEELRAAATFWRKREEWEPDEVDDTVSRSAALLRFEDAISETLIGVEKG